MPTNELDQPVGVPVPGWSPRPMPGGLPLRGRFVDVVPFTDDHLAGLFAATCGPDDEALWTYMPGGPYRLVTELRDAIDRYRDAPDAAVHALLVDGEVAGMACYLRAQPRIGVVEVGHIVHGRSLARTAAATEAQYLLAGHVFDLGYRRYEWKCDSLNEPSTRAAVRLGFRHEGRFRQALVYKGRNRDTDWFAMTDQDWAVLAPAYQRWLGGVGDDGRQSCSLAELTRAALDG